MRKLVLVLVVVAICVAVVTAGKKDRERKDRRKEGKRARPQADAAQPADAPTEDTANQKRDEPATQRPSDGPRPSPDAERPGAAGGGDAAANSRCGEWRWQACELRAGRQCGKGVERATRDGDKCKKKEQTQPCRVECEAKQQKTKREGKSRERGAGSESRDRQRTQPPRKQRVETPAHAEGNDRKCKYNKKDWTDCDQQTSLQTRVYTLKSGDSDACPPKKIITKPCDKYQRRLENKNGCEYVLGQWSVCNATSDMRERRDTLIDPTKEAAGCRAIRDIHQRCAVACVYSWGEWSDCDEEEGKRSITGTLDRDDITPPDCEPTVSKTKPCYGKNGIEKCFFGPWSGFGKCVGGFKLRTRKLLVGDRRCELRASHAVPCKG